MSFGYSTVDIKEEGIQIYTPDNLKYIDRLPKKNIVLKWFQKNEVGSNTAYGIIDTLDEAKEKNYSVYWYRYRIGASEDELAGAFWELLDAGAYNDNISYGYELVEDPNGKYTYKDSKLILADSDNAEEKRYRMKIKTTPGTGRYENEISASNPYNISFAPDKLLSREKIKAILVKYEFEEIQEVDENDSNIVYITFKLSPKIYESNEIIFENVNPASLSLAAVDLIRNMRLECQDGSNGIYKLYNGVDNVIIGNEDTRDRTLNVIFDTYSTIDIPLDEEKCSIKWKIPKDNSMIHTVNFSINNTDEISIPNDQQKNIVWQTEGNYYTCSYNWVSNIAGTDNHYEGVSLPVHYCIHDYYAQSYSNNTIICEITKYNRVYTAKIEFIFGETGTNGTGYTLNLRLEKEYDLYGNSLTETPVPCLTADENKKVKVIATLFDEHGNDITDKKIISWNWRKNNSSGFSLLKDGNNSCYVKYTGDVGISQCYGILQAMVSSIWNGNTIQLTGYLPIGIRAAANSMLFYNGTTKVIYDAQGSNPVFQAEHSLDTETTSWKVKVLDDSSLERYAPYFKRETNEIGPWNLAVRDIYFTDLSAEKIVIQAFKGTSIVYTQSLLYDQNRFGNAMFNDWDGSLTIDKDGNKILSALIGAGKKETNNTFSGVLMGDFTYKTSTKTEGSIETKTVKKTGLLGFKNSLETFGFHTDGTAFIGPAGQGRIEFDGTRGIIESYTGNTRLNLTTGEIYLANDDKASAKIILDSTGNSGYFSIKDKDNDKNLIYIGSTGYYLQSKNFSDDDTSKTGVKFDLNTGKLTGYDFLIQAGQGDKKLIIDSDSESKPLIIGTNFKVDWNGKIEATGGKFSGTLTAATGTFTGTITADEGKIAGWTINKYGLHNGGAFGDDGTYTIPSSGSYAVFSPNGTTLVRSATESIKNVVFNIGKNLAIDKDGVIHAAGAQLGGYTTSTDFSNLKATYGSIIRLPDGKELGDTATFLAKGDNIEGYGIEGYYNQSDKKFYESYDYKNETYKTEIKPKNKYIYIDKFTGKIYLYTTESSSYTEYTGKVFTVSTEGLLTANNAVISGTIYATNGWFSGGITASEGQIGGYTIGDKSLSYGTSAASDNSFYLWPEGEKIYSNDTWVTKNRNVNFEITSGGDNYSMIIGDKFGVTTEGVVNCKNLILSTEDCTTDIVESGLSIRGIAKDDNNKSYVVSALITSGLIGVNMLESNTDTIGVPDSIESSTTDFASAINNALDAIKLLIPTVGMSPSLGFYTPKFKADIEGNVYAEKFYTNNNNSTDLQTQINGKASTSHTHSNYALTSHTHSNYALTNHLHNNVELLNYSTGYYMGMVGSNASSAQRQSVTFRKISEQSTTGIVLVFKYYDYETNPVSHDNPYICRYIPKSIIPASGYIEINVSMNSLNYGIFGCKKLRIYDNKIEGTKYNGHRFNDISAGYTPSDYKGTSAGVKYDNRKFRLYKVIAV